MSIGSRKVSCHVHESLVLTLDTGRLMGVFICGFSHFLRPLLVVNDTNQATRSFQVKGRLALEERFHCGKSFRRRGGRAKPFAEFGGCWSPEGFAIGANVG